VVPELVDERGVADLVAHRGAEDPVGERVPLGALVPQVEAVDERVEAELAHLVRALLAEGEGARVEDGEDVHAEVPLEVPLEHVLLNQHLEEAEHLAPQVDEVLQLRVALE